MSLESATSTLLDLESRYGKDLMSFCIDGYHLYPLIRSDLLLFLQRHTCGLEQAHATGRQRSGWAASLARTLLTAFFRRNPLVIAGTRDIVVFSTAAERKAVVDGRYFNVIYDYLIPCAGRPYLLVEEMHQYRHRVPVHTRSLVYREVLSVLARLFRKRRIDVATVRRFDQMIRDMVRELTAAPAPSLSSVEQHIRMGLAFAGLCRALFSRWRPKLVFVEDGCYGSYNALLLRVCDDMGIPTAEFQHGWVGEQHLAYCYAIDVPDYARYLPDYFLTFGQYWSDVLRKLPCHKIVVGNPHLSSRVRNSSPSASGASRVLFVSDGNQSGEFSSLALQLRELLPADYDIIFRLHPGEVPFLNQRYGSLLKTGSITVSTSGDIYDLFQDCHHIVGIGSTVLFEALPFQKRIYVLKNDYSRAYVPPSIGTWFTRATELAKSILSAGSDSAPPDWRYYWELNWESRFRSFLDAVLAS